MLFMMNDFLPVSTGTKRRERAPGRESEFAGVGGCPWTGGRCTAGPGVLPSAPGPPTWRRDLGGIRAQSLPCLGWGLVGHCAQPSGVSSHPVGTGSPSKSGLGCSSTPRGNSLPGRPREGWSGAARPPGTPRTPRACRLRVGAGRKNTAWMDTCSAQGSQPSPRRATSRDTGVPVCWFHGASWHRSWPFQSCALVVLFARVSPAPSVTGPLWRPCTAPRGVGGSVPVVPGSRAGSVARERTPGGASFLVSGTLRPKPGRCLSR